MINGLVFILEIIVIGIVAFTGYSILKKYVFSRLKVNKWMIIGIVIAVFAVPFILSLANVIKMNSIFSKIQSGIVVILFLWLMDTMGWGAKSQPAKGNLKTNKTKYTTTPVIKAKAKPNRLKNTDMEVIDIKDIKKKKKK